MTRIEQAKSIIKAFADPCDEVIYHYTSAEGLKGIIETSEIQLTNAAFVNDTTECRALRDEKSLFAGSDFSNKHVKDKWQLFMRPSYDDHNNTYIVSFSCGEESLEQWRSYGNFRIGFRAKDLVKPPFNLYRCVYCKEEIKNWIIEKSKLNGWAGDSLDDPAKRAVAFVLIDAASKKYKNKHFMEEREVRLVVTSNHTWGFYPESPSMFEADPPIHYRIHTAYKIPVPYVKLFVEDGSENGQKEEIKETARQMKERKLKEERVRKRNLLPITEVLIGPMLHQKEAKIACEILLKDKGYEKVEVNVSNIPYRGFQCCEDFWVHAIESPVMGK